MCKILTFANFILSNISSVKIIRKRRCSVKWGVDVHD